MALRSCGSSRVLDSPNDLGDPLNLNFVREQLPADPSLSWTEDEPLEDVITNRIFCLGEPPRRLLLFHAGELLLIDRTKWPERRLLRFHFDTLFTNSDGAKLLAALTTRENVRRCQPARSAG